VKKQATQIEHIPAIVWGEPSNCAYLYVHGKFGNKEEAERFAEIANRWGHQVVSIDLNLDQVAQGVWELETVGRYLQKHWQEVSLFAISLGAYFSLLAFYDFSMKKALLLSPILELGRLIGRMMEIAGVNEEELQEKGVIGELDWSYLSYVREHPITNWEIPTAILYGDKDDLIELSEVEDFSGRFQCTLTVLPGASHWFHEDWQFDFLEKWLEMNMNKEQAR